MTATAEQWTRVGPLVIPGVTSCLRCFDFVQSDRDSSWPTVAAQLDPVSPTVAGDSNLVTATAAIAVMHLLEAIDLKKTAISQWSRPSCRCLTEPCCIERAPSSPQCGCTWGPLPQRPARADEWRHNGRVSDLPRKAVTRSAKLASLPLGFAGRTALGLGKRVGGKPAEAVIAEVQQRTAEQMFKVLGELKGGAMKVGQAMSVFEAALPDELAGPYRAALGQLQEAAPALPAATVHQVLAEQMGPSWRQSSGSSTTSQLPPPPSVRFTGRRGATAPMLR